MSTHNISFHVEIKKSIPFGWNNLVFGAMIRTEWVKHMYIMCKPYHVYLGVCSLPIIIWTNQRFIVNCLCLEQTWQVYSLRRHVALRKVLTWSCLHVFKWLWFCALVFLCPATKKVAGYYVIPSEILSVRPSVHLSIRPSVCTSVSAPTILLPATPPTVLGQSFSNFTGAFRMVWRYAYCFFRILKLFFITFFFHF